MQKRGRAGRRQGDETADLAAAYQQYASGLYDFCVWATGEVDTAEDAVHGALIAALARRGLLSQPRMLRAWLYAAARNECLRVRRRRPAEILPPVEETPLTRVRAVAAGLTRHEQEVAELAFRHRLTPAELGVVLGRPARAAKQTIMQVYSTLATGYGADGAQAFDTAMTAVPEPLYARVVASARIPDRIGYFGERAQPYTRSGYPVPLDRPRSRRGLYLGAAAAAVVLVVILAMVLTGGQPQSRVAANLPSDPRVEVPLPEAAGSPTPTGTPVTPSASPTPTPSPTAPAPERSTVAPVPAAPLKPVPAVRTEIRSVSGCTGNSWSMRIAVIATGAIGTSAEATWWIEGSPAFPPQSTPASAAQGNTFEVTLQGLPGNQPVSYRGSVTSIDDRTGQSRVDQISRACGGRKERRPL